MSDDLERLKAALGDRYRIERRLGAGAMAVVYLAHDLQRERQVAVKVLRPELAAVVGESRFLREIQISAHFTHPHIVPLYDSGQADGLLYSIMPYIPGGTLRERILQEKQLSVVEAVRLSCEVADGLSYAHGIGIVHRDIKPENILFEGGHAVISDFGVAQAVSDGAGDRLTATGIAVGTPIYMSPEQAMGQRRLDGRTDVYSLACVLYEMLAGDPPFTGANPQAVLTRKSVESPPSLRAVRETVSEGLEEVILKALAKAPADRFSTAAAFAAALESAASRTSASTPRRRRKRWASALGGFVAVVLLLAGGWWAWQRPDARIDSLAVLPVRNLSGDATPAYVVDAMHGSIITELGHIASLRTISQWSAQRYRDVQKSATEIARELGVKALVEASLYASAESVSVHVELVQAEPQERRLWGHTYTAELRELQTLQSDVARDIANEVRAVLTPEEALQLAQVQLVAPEAYDAYAQGRYAWNKYTADGAREAIVHFQAAIAKDPTYALAYAGLADAYIVLPYYADADPRELFPKAKAAAVKALELDGTLAEAYSALAWTAATYDWDWAQAETYHLQALKLNPGYAVGRMRYAFFLAWVGRSSEAIAQDLVARELDPLSPRIMAHLGLMYQLARNYGRAIQLYRETIARYPGFSRVRFDLGRVYCDVGNYASAILELEQALALVGPKGSGSATSSASLAIALAKAGRRPEAMRILAALQEKPPRGDASAFNIALIYVALSDRARAFQWLERALAAHDENLILLKAMPNFDPIRSDARFRSLVRRMRFPA